MNSNELINVFSYRNEDGAKMLKFGNVTGQKKLLDGNRSPFPPMKDTM